MRVLIVDDTTDVRLVLRHALEFSEIEVVEASGGPEALTLLREGLAPDVVLLDVQMPVMDGWDTLQAIRADRSTKDVPVVMCTVKSTGADLVRGWELGCDGYVRKPFDVFTIVEIARAVAVMTPDQRRAARANGLALAQSAV